MKLLPSGNPVTVKLEAPKVTSLPQDRAIFLDSGTSALILALSTAKMLAPPQKNEVVIPGYVCPTVLAACEYVNLKAIVVDTCQDFAHLGVSEAAEEVSSKTLAIISVSFLGARQDLTALRSIASSVGALIILDAAQEKPNLDLGSADFKILSFGRGKQLNLLGGGALIFSEECSQIYPIPCKRQSSHFFEFRALLFNRALKSGALAKVYYLPGSPLGRTSYKGATPPCRLDSYRSSLASNMCETSLETDTLAQDFVRLRLADKLNTRSTTNARPPEKTILLRFPILFSSESDREIAYTKCLRIGGVSKMYNASLRNIHGVPLKISQLPANSNADSYAVRLLTLPLHNYASLSDLEDILNIVSQYRITVPSILY
ncbi:MAG: aminotransferase class V-fold PLP-dependent enzyme [Pseudomonadales bacterium]|nr:aminotransferase class V-fold PLP-dependent enzyme [Pseudomonadales bacterium]